MEKILQRHLIVSLHKKIDLPIKISSYKRWCWTKNHPLDRHQHLSGNTVHLIEFKKCLKIVNHLNCKTKLHVLENLSPQKRLAVALNSQDAWLKKNKAAHASSVMIISLGSKSTSLYKAVTSVKQKIVPVDRRS